MWRKIAKQLELFEGAAHRDFVLSVSGGPDSMVLAACFLKIARHFDISFSVFHMNFGLRGKDSERDEDLVRKFCRKNKINLVTKNVQMDSSSPSIQQRARNFRLSEMARVLPSAEWVEAHHLDDQIETFLFRVFRGASLSGLQSMKVKSIRCERVVWRPLLSFSKKKILKYAKKHEIKYRIDRSNETSAYSRNFIRNELMPLIKDRFPAARKNIGAVIEHIQEENSWREMEVETSLGRLFKKLSKIEFEVDRTSFLDAPQAKQRRLVHSFFLSHFEVVLGREQLIGLCKRLRQEPKFAWNAPQGLVLRVSNESWKVLRATPRREKAPAEAR